MFERFTERARQVTVLAQEEARNIPSNHLGTEHILLGCMVEEEGLAARVLTNLGLNAKDLRDTIPPDHETKTNEQIPFTPRAKKVLELSLREALSQGHNYIGTEHILLALARESGGIVGAYLKERLGHNYCEIITLDVMELLRGPRPTLGEVDLNQEEREELKLKDVLADVMTGFNMWKEAKQLNAEDWTDADEAFSRWIDGAGVSEFL